MTITIALASTVLLALYLILVGLSHLGVVSWRYYHILLGLLALLAGILLILGR